MTRLAALIGMIFKNELEDSMAEPAHILVIDDDDRLRDLLRRFLTESGFRVSDAANAADARHLLQSLHFDLLVIDVMMPGETGVDFLQLCVQPALCQR